MVEWLSEHEDADVDTSSFISGWFLGMPTSEIGRDDAIEFLAWAMYAANPGELSKAERKSVVNTVSGRAGAGCASREAHGDLAAAVLRARPERPRGTSGVRAERRGGIYRDRQTSWVRRLIPGGPRASTRTLRP